MDLPHFVLRVESKFVLSYPKSKDFIPGGIITYPGNMKIGVILPSRGLVFAEVEDSISRNLKGYDYFVYRSWDKKIPDCENELVDIALQNGSDYLFFCEEDTVMPDGGFGELLKAGADIACIDYGVAGWSCITRDKNTNEILWCGLGCTLIKREVFEKLEKPYFKSDKQLLLNFWPEIRWIDAPRNAYGGQDIYFCIKAREKGFTIKQVEGECKHLKLLGLGRPGINNGLHTIGQKPMINKHNTI